MFTGAMSDLYVWDMALTTAQLDQVRLGRGLPTLREPLISAMRTWCGSHMPPQAPPSSPLPPVAPCAVEGLFSFNGSDASYVSVSSRTGRVGGGLGLTISVWVYRTRSGSAWDRVFDFGNGQQSQNILIGFDKAMSYHVYDSTSTAAVSTLEVITPAFPVNAWTHVALVQTRNSAGDASGAARIYWDGVLRASSSTFRFPGDVLRSGLYVGKSHWSIDPMFTGMMSDLYVWDAALSESELEQVRLGRGLPSERAPLISAMRTWCGAHLPPGVPPSPPSSPPCPPPTPPPSPPPPSPPPLTPPPPSPPPPSPPPPSPPPPSPPPPSPPPPSPPPLSPPPATCLRVSGTLASINGIYSFRSEDGSFVREDALVVIRTGDSGWNWCPAGKVACEGSEHVWL